MVDGNMDCTRTLLGNEPIESNYVNMVIKPEQGFKRPLVISSADSQANPHSSNCQQEWRDGHNMCSKGLCDRINDVHYIGGLRSQMKLKAWTREINSVIGYDKKEYLLNGITNGFPIVDTEMIPRYECANYGSCSKKGAHRFISGLFKEERLQGIVVPTSVRPHCVHAIGAIRKKDMSFRPIIDCRRPIGHSINNYMSTTCQPFRYKSLDMVCDRLERGDYMSCTDIQSAYRSISILPEHRKFQGFKWTDEEGLYLILLRHPSQLRAKVCPLHFLYHFGFRSMLYGKTWIQQDNKLS